MNNRIRNSFIRQQGKSDCGVACLASVIAYHGGTEPLENIRAVSGTSREGTTLLGLYQAATRFGLHAEGLEAECADNLKELSEPAILSVLIDDKLQHYFVFYGFDRSGKAIIGDPASGVQTYSIEELERVWPTKALLTLTPGDSFVKNDLRKKDKRKWIVDLIREDVNILLIALFLGVFITGLGLSMAVFSQKLIDEILPAGNAEKLIFSLVVVTALLVARSVLSYLRSFILLQQGIDFNKRIIDNFYGSILKVPKFFFDSRKTGELIARMSDTKRIQSTISIISGNVVIDLLLVVSSIIFIFFYSVAVGCVVLGVVPVYLGLLYLFSGKIFRGQKQLMHNFAITESHYVDSIQGVTTIKSANREPFFEELNRKIYGVFQDSFSVLGRLNIRFALVTEITGVVLICLIFAMSSFMVLSETMETGEMVALLSIAGNIIPSINRLVISNVQIQEAIVAFDRMYEFTSIKPEYDAGLARPAISQDGADLEIKNVSFRFPGRSQMLKNVSLRLQHGKLIVLSGESGGGKSTLVQIIQKFYSPESGKICYNDVPVQNIPTDQWRDIYALVPQEIKVFNGSLLYNITLSEKKEDFDYAVKLCKHVGLDSYFQSFPQAYITILGEEGVSISGGQRQLMALARALFRRPQILLLDEGTSAMDRNTESFVLDLLSKLKSHIAILMISHNVRVAQRADYVYVLDNGSISRSGLPAELVGEDVLSINL